MLESNYGFRGLMPRASELNKETYMKSRVPLVRVLLSPALQAAAIAVVIFGTLASAQELYAPAPPPDAAFVRVVHADEALGEVSPEVGDAAFDPLAFGLVSPYQVVTQGESELSAGELSESFEIEAGRFYTAVLTGEGAILLEDPTPENSARALLVLYNLSELPVVELRTADGDTEVIAGVESGSLGSIDVNPIAAAFGAFDGATDGAIDGATDGATPVASFDEVQLGRGEVYSAFVFGTPEAASATFELNTTQTLE